MIKLAIDGIIVGVGDVEESQPGLVRLRRMTLHTPALPKNWHILGLKRILYGVELSIEPSKRFLLVSQGSGVSIEGSVATVEEVVFMEDPDFDEQRPLLDSTVRELGSVYGSVSTTKGPSGIAFIVASGDDANRLSRYIRNHWK